MARNKVETKFHYKGWNGRSVNSNLITLILEKIEKSPADIFFKKKENRTVFKFSENGKDYFAKENNPSGFRDEFREFIRPKSKVEYKIGKKLEKVGSPVVKSIGWARKSSKNILVTESPEGKVTTLKEFLSDFDSFPTQKRSKFVAAVAKFIKEFIAKRLQHPDLHFGNILVIENDDDINMFLVDLYGVKFRFGYFNVFKSGIWLFLVVIKKFLTESEMINIFKESDLIMSDDEYRDVMSHISLYEVWHTQKLWSGRKKKILEGTNSRYVERVNDTYGAEVFIRKDLKFNPDDITSKKLPIDALPFQREKAQRLWLASIYLEMQEIPHARVWAWKKAKVEGEDDAIYIDTRKEWSEIKSLSEIDDQFLLKCKDVLGRGFYEEPDSFVRDKEGKVMLIDYASIEKL